MRDLVALATEAASTEVRVERDHQAALKLARETFDKGQWSLTQRYDALRQKTREKYEQKVAAAGERYRSESAAVRAADEPARRKVLGEFEQVGQLVQRKTEHAVWMADSVLEVSLNQLKEQDRRLRDEVAGHVATLNEMERDARQRAARYGYMPAEAPAEVEAAPAATPEEAAATFEARRGAGAPAGEGLPAARAPEPVLGGTPR